MIMDLHTLPRALADGMAEAVGMPGLWISRRRNIGIARYRQRIQYLLAQNFKLSYPEIGRGTERDHTTVMYSEAKTAERIKNDPAELAEVERLERLINAYLERKME